MSEHVNFSTLISTEIDRKNHVVKFDIGELAGYKRVILIHGGNLCIDLDCRMPYKNEFYYVGDSDTAMECVVTFVCDISKYIPGMVFMDTNNRVRGPITEWDENFYDPSTLTQIDFVGYDQYGNPKFIKKESEYNPGIIYWFKNLRLWGFMQDDIKMIFPLMPKDICEESEPTTINTANTVMELF